MIYQFSFYWSKPYVGCIRFWVDFLIFDSLLFLFLLNENFFSIMIESQIRINKGRFVRKKSLAKLTSGLESFIRKSSPDKHLRSKNFEKKPEKKMLAKPTERGRGSKSHPTGHVRNKLFTKLDKNWKSWNKKNKVRFANDTDKSIKKIDEKNKKKEILGAERNLKSKSSRYAYVFGYRYKFEK